MKLKDNRYRSVVNDLYDRLLDSIKLRDQWKKVNKSEWIENVLKYQNQAECILELLENVTVLYVGGGYNMEFGSSFENRVKSFSFLKESVNES